VLSLPDAVRVFVARAPVDFRKAHDGLCQIVRDVFGDDPLSGHLFVFTNRRRNRLKILFFDRNGLWLCYKRLERGTFPRFGLEGTKPRVEVDRSWLAMLLDGFVPFSAKVHAHHVRRVCIEGRRTHGRTQRPSRTHR
jgi:transposase